MTYYMPGRWESIAYMEEVSKAAKLYNDKVVFMVVNTKINTEYMRKKEYGIYLIIIDNRNAKQSLEFILRINFPL